MNAYAELFPLAGEIHRVDNAKWWLDLATGESILTSRPRLSLLMLVVTEVSEYVDAVESGARDEHCPEFSNAAIELADVAIRELDLIGAEDEFFGTSHIGRFTTVEAPGVMSLIQALSLAAECYRKERFNAYRSALNSALWITCQIALQAGVDLVAAVQAKRAYNRSRADHSIEHRRAAGGKKE